MKILINFLILTLLCGCAGPQMLAGDVIPLQTGSTLWGIQQAALGKPGTVILVKDTITIFAWPVSENYGMAVVNSNTKEAVTKFAELGLKGNLTGVRDASDMIRSFGKEGWTKVTPDKLHPEILAGLASAKSWLVMMASNMPTFVIMPAGIFPVPPEVYIIDG